MPFVKAVNDTIINADLGSTINMQCETTGYPLPNMRWVVPPRTTGKVIEERGIFKVQNITKYDQGQYKCQASNLGGFAEETFTILINGACNFLSELLRDSNPDGNSPGGVVRVGIILVGVIRVKVIQMGIVLEPISFTRKFARSLRKY